MYRIYKLLEHQREQMIRFLLREAPVSPELEQEQCPLPILGDLRNRERVDPEEPLEETGIYRDLWERRPLLYPDVRGKDVVDTFNYLDFDDWLEAVGRGPDIRCGTRMR